MAITISGDSPNLTSPNITGAVLSSMASSVITTGTSVATTSGTNILIATGIPSWVKRVTISINGLSLNSSTSIPAIQLGTGGSLTTTGYSGGGSRGSTNLTSNSTYLQIIGNTSSSNVYVGIITLITTGNNTWLMAGNTTASSNDPCTVTAGAVTLSGTLERINLLNSLGVAFTAGSINILYE
jgi:hypothetical protein